MLSTVSCGNCHFCKTGGNCDAHMNDLIWDHHMIIIPANFQNIFANTYQIIPLSPKMTETDEGWQPLLSGGALTHIGRVTHIYVSKLTIIGLDNGLAPGRRQAIIWTNDGILLIRTFRTHFSEIVSEIHTYSFKKMHFEMSSGKWRPSCLGLNVLNF